jgi:hypothetical protein
MPHSRAAGGDLIWRPTRLAIYARDGWSCLICGAEPPRGDELRALAEQLGAGLRGIDVREGALDRQRARRRDVHRRRRSGLIEREHPMNFFAALAAAQGMA